jgi:hypothetical protein
MRIRTSNQLISHIINIYPKRLPLRKWADMSRLNFRCGTSKTLECIVAVSALETVDDARLFPFAETGLYPYAALPDIPLHLLDFGSTRIYIKRKALLKYGICLSASVLLS